MMTHSPSSTPPATSANEASGSTERFQLRLDDEQRALGEALLRKSGVDFAKLQRKELVDHLGTILVVWEHIAVFVLAATPGVVVALLSWWFFYGEADPATRFVFFFVALLSGLVLGALCGIIGVALRVLVALDELAAEGVRAMDEVRNEVRAIRPGALRKLSMSDWTKGVAWIVVLPSVDFVLRRRLRIRPLSALASGTMRRVFRQVVPPALEGNATHLSGVSSEASEGGADDDAAWLRKVRQLEPLTAKTTRALRRWVVIPLIGAAVLTLALIVGGGWTVAALFGL